MFLPRVEHPPFFVNIEGTKKVSFCIKGRCIECGKKYWFGWKVQWITQEVQYINDEWSEDTKKIKYYEHFCKKCTPTKQHVINYMSVMEL